ncbi:hypothetical protein K701_01120 [Streptomyces fradiae ATCC 10745 = DSM 40063]|uniref:Integral membrane bound transporter domain-containing protein n=1 Tax=Streptomyces fradiae ATCC 10745 = DSM 40063 TaxID=1319510 RepID=A0ABQ6Y0M7_STRFR|nr:hypothetical protein K701_01120 [Streptomyces fradiae ATCC 10745 = DSM 40063]
MLALPLHGAPGPTAVLVAVCVFGIFYTAPVSYSWMMLAVTVMAGLLYGLLGVLTPGLLVLRAAETGVGALFAALAVTFVLPVTTHATNDAWIQRALLAVRRCTAEAAERLAGSPTADPAPHAAELEVLLGRVRMALAPLVHPLSPFRDRKARARQVLALLDDCARELRGLTVVAADPDAGRDARLAAACWRVEAAVEALLRGRERVLEGAGPEAAGSLGSAARGAETAGAGAEASGPCARAAVPGAPRATAPDGAPALAHLRGLERLLAELDGPLRTAPRSLLVRS